MADDGKGPDPRVDDGQYSGTLTIPSTATGKLNFTGQISGQGIADSDTPFPTTVSAGRPPVSAEIDLTAPERVSPGGTVAGSILVGNQSGTDIGVRVTLTGYDNGTLVALTSPTVTTVPPVGQVRIPVVLTFNRDTKQGTVQLVLVAANAANPAQRYDSRQYNFRVAYPPPFWRRAPWVYLEIAAGVLLVLAILAITARRMYLAGLRDMRGMVALLYVNGKHQEFPAPDRRDQEFRFITRDDGNGELRLDHPLPTDQAYVMTRDVDGIVRVQTPYGNRIQLRPGDREPIGDGMMLGYRDSRNRPVSGAQAATYVPGRGETRIDGDGSGDEPAGQRTYWSDESPPSSDDYNTI